MGNYDCDCRTGTCCAECCTTCKEIENNIEADNTSINGADYDPCPDTDEAIFPRAVTDCVGTRS